MGRFFSLAVLLPLAACGDNMVSDPNPEPLGPQFDVDDIGNDPVITARLVPSVCGVSSWDSNITKPVVDVAVAGRPEGATVLSVPRDGGTPSGFVVDTRMRMVAGETKVAIDLPLSQIAVSYLGDRIATTGIAGDSVYLHLLDDDLSNPQFVMKMPATAVSKPAFYRNVADDVIMPIGTESGLAFARFADSGEPIDNQLMVRSKPVRSIATTQFGTATLTAWSTDSECYLMQTSTYSAGKTGYKPIACPNPSIAVSPANGDGLMVYESPEGVRAMFAHDDQFNPEAVLLRGDTTGPRTLFDGKRFWVSFLDSRGDVIVGFMQPDHHLTTLSLGGPKPYTSAYQLVLVDNAPWIFALDDTGYTGHRLCAQLEQ